jgi:hypothetical protein
MEEIVFTSFNTRVDLKINLPIRRQAIHSKFGIQDLSKSTRDIAKARA